MSLIAKLAPILSKFRGDSPLCPWSSTFRTLHPRVWRVRPPLQRIEVVDRDEAMHLLRFADKHSFWFPRETQITSELWSEYLAVYWNHPLNGHYYLRHRIDIGPDDVVVDCGGCEGFFTRQAIELGARQVVCVEPNSEMIRCLEKTFANEIARGQVILVSAAVGGHRGEANFSVDACDAFSGKFSDQTGDTVQVVTLDQLAADWAYQPTLIKMDLEGSEYEALRGGAGIIAAHRPKLAITTYHESWDYAVVSSLLVGLGYRNFNSSSATMRNGNVARSLMIYAY